MCERMCECVCVCVWAGLSLEKTCSAHPVYFSFISSLANSGQEKPRAKLLLLDESRRRGKKKSFILTSTQRTTTTPTGRRILLWNEPGRIKNCSHVHTTINLAWRGEKKKWILNRGVSPFVENQSVKFKHHRTRAGHRQQQLNRSPEQRSRAQTGVDGFGNTWESIFMQLLAMV